MNQFDLAKTQFFVYHIHTKIKDPIGYTDYDTAHNRCKELNEGLNIPLYLIGTHKVDKEIDQSTILKPTDKYEGLDPESSRKVLNTNEDN